MRRLYPSLLTLLASALLVPAALAQQGQPPPAHAATVLADQQAHVERLARAFPPSRSASGHGADALQAAVDTYVLAQRSEYFADEEGFFQPSTQTRIEYENTRGTDGLLRKTETSYTWTGDEFAPDSLARYVHEAYPPHFLLLRIEEEKWDPSANNGAGGFVLTGNRFNTFAGNQGSSLPAATHYQVRVGDEWRFVERTLFRFGGTGLSAYYTEGEKQVWTGGPMQNDPQFWQPTERFLVEQSNIDVVYTEQEWNGAAWVSTTRTRYLDVTILELNNRLLKMIQDLEELGGVLYALRLPDHVTQEWDGTTWITVARQRTETFYDSSTGNVIRAEATGEVFEGGEWLPESRMVRAYEPFQSTSRVALTDLEVFDGEEWALFLRESYDYSATSQRVSTVTWEMAGEDEFFAILRIEYDWRLAGDVTSTDPGPVAGRFALDAPYPNPAATGATVTYRLEVAAAVSVRVYDALGRRVATLFEGEQAAGAHPLALDASALPSGLYFVRLEGPGVQQTRPLTVMR